MSSQARLALRLLSPRIRVYLGLSSALHLLSRLALPLFALTVVREIGKHALMISVGIGALFAVRAAVTATAKRLVRQSLIAHAMHALLHGDVLRATALADADTQLAVFEGVFAGERLGAELLPTLAADLLASLAIGAFFVTSQPARVVLLGGVGLACAGAGVALARRLTARASEHEWRAYRPVTEAILAGIGGRLEIVARGARCEYLADLWEQTERWRAAAAHAQRLSALAGRAPLAAAGLGIVMLFFADASMRGEPTHAMLTQIAVLVTLVPSFMGVAQGSQEALRTTSKIAPLARLLEAARGPAGTGREPIPSLPAPIVFRDVHFRYPAEGSERRPPALARVNLVWNPGEVLVLRGPNGSGKSTCLRLLLGLGRPARGSITVGEKDLFDFDLDAWRKQIAYLPQRPFLPERASVREAIRLIEPGASDERMRGALERVGVWPGLTRIAPNAPLGVVVSTLSVGQRQRVALARLLVQDGPLVLLDEPDANLDAAGIALVAELVGELSRARMVAVVAHTEAVVGVSAKVISPAA